MNNLRIQINERCTGIKLPEEYEHINPAENTDNLTRLLYNESSQHFDKPIQYLSNKSNNSHFKLTIIPDLYLLKAHGKKVRFILFRIKYVIKEKVDPHKIFSIPILDLSYHFCEDQHQLTHINYELFLHANTKIFIIKNYEDDFYEQMFELYKHVDEMQPTQLNKAEREEKLVKIRDRMSKYLPARNSFRSRKNNFGGNTMRKLMTGNTSGGFRKTKKHTNKYNNKTKSKARK
jgi:hypothetical protein